MINHFSCNAGAVIAYHSENYHTFVVFDGHDGTEVEKFIDALQMMRAILERALAHPHGADDHDIEELKRSLEELDKVIEHYS
jgi:serine/threonine protein phosphatase PrpC